MTILIHYRICLSSWALWRVHHIHTVCACSVFIRAVFVCQCSWGCVCMCCVCSTWYACNLYSWRITHHTQWQGKLLPLPTESSVYALCAVTVHDFCHCCDSKFTVWLMHTIVFTFTLWEVMQLVSNERSLLSSSDQHMTYWLWIA